LIDEAQARLSVTSPEADRVVRVVSRRLRLASGQMRRVVDHCQVGRTAKARAAVRDALRRIEGARTAAQARARQAPEPTRLTAGDLSRLEALAQELRALVGKLSCP
jgi:Arc/MetJ-type ribon-helix-helix transcriptional regulator